MLKRYRLAVVRLLFVVAASFAPATPSEAEEPVSTDAPAAYRGYLESLNRITFRALVKKRFVQGSKVETGDADQGWDIDLPGRALHVSSSGQGLSAKGASELRLFEEHVSKDLLCAAGGSAERGEIDLMTATLPVPEDYWPRLVPWSYAAPAVGYLKIGSNYQRICDVLDGADIISRDASKCALRKEVGKSVLEVTLNPAKGWMAEKVVCKGDGEVVFTVSEVVIVNGVPFPRAYEIAETLPPRDVAQPAGVRVVNGRVVFDPTDANGPPKTTRVAGSVLTSRVELQDVTINPEGRPAPTFLAKVPDGVKVDVADARHLEHVWYHGSIVPFTGDVFRELTDAQFHKPTSSARQALLWLNVAVIAIVGLAFGVRWLRGRS